MGLAPDADDGRILWAMAEPAAAAFHRLQLAPPRWSILATIIGVMFIYCHLAALFGTEALRMPRDGVVFPAWNAAYGLELREDFDNVHWRIEHLPEVDVSKIALLRNAVAVLLAAFVVSIAGFCVTLLAPDPAGPWWRQRQYLRMLAWTLTLFPWVYFCIYLAAGAGHPLLVQEMFIPGSAFNANYEPSADPAWSIVFLILFALGTAFGLALYRRLNGHRLTIARMLGVDDPESGTFTGYQGMPSLRGAELGVVKRDGSDS